MSIKYQIFIIAAVVLITAGCRTTPTSVLSAEPTSLSFTVEGGSKTFVVTANVFWTISKPPAWIEVKPTSGNGIETVTVTVKANTTNINLEDDLNITATDVPVVTVVVRQNASTLLPVTNMTINGIVPVTGATSVTTIETTQYGGKVVWYPDDAVFAPTTDYSATITLTAKGVYTLYGVAENSFIVTGAISHANVANSGVITAVFPITGETPTIAATSTGLASLKAGQAVSDASIVYTLSHATYAATITPDNFAVTGLPAGLTAADATRTGNTAVTVAISGTPTTASENTAAITIPSAIPQANVTGAGAAVVAVSGTVTAGAVAMGDGASVSQPAVSGTPTHSSITVGAVTLTPTTTGQSAQYAITTNTSTTMPSDMTWQAESTFNNLTDNTAFYVWARSEANNNFNAGTAVRSAAIFTPAWYIGRWYAVQNPTSTITITFNANGSFTIDERLRGTYTFNETSNQIIFTATHMWLLLSWQPITSTPIPVTYTRTDTQWTVTAVSGIDLLNFLIGLTFNRL